jgi:hypothetical protein
MDFDHFVLFTILFGTMKKVEILGMLFRICDRNADGDLQAGEIRELEALILSSMTSSDYKNNQSAFRAVHSTMEKKGHFTFRC